MICGVNIGGKDTLEEWGLMLCNDLSIGAAVPRYRFIEIPEMSGALDLTEALTGSVPYDQRTITFTLFAVHDVIAGTRTPATEEHFQMVLARFSGFANGKRLHVYLPDNPDHYFVGRVSVGGKSGYNSGRVKVEVLADPYRLKDGETTLTVDDDDFFKTATPGALVTFDDGGDNLPMKSCVVTLVPEQDLNGFDSPWPAGGGKNLLQTNDFADYTNNGVTWHRNDDGSVVLNGTATARSYKYLNGGYYLKLEPGTYTVSASGIESGGAFGNLAYSTTENGSYAGTFGTLGGTVPKRTFTVENTIYLGLLIDVPSGTTNSNRLIKVQIEVGSTATEWSPYSNICPISGHTGAELIRTGKNLLSNEVNSATSSGVTFTVNSDRSITVSTQDTATGRANLFYTGELHLPSSNYYLSIGKAFARGECYFEIKIYRAATGTSQYMNTDGVSGFAFTLNDGDYIQQLYFSVFSGKSVNDTIYPQIELGSSASSYEPYQGDTYSVTFTDQGTGTVYGGTVDLVSGKLTVDRAMVDLGDLTWTMRSDSVGNYFQSQLSPTAKPKTGSQLGNNICSIYPISPSSNVFDKSLALNNAGNLIYVRDADYSDATTFKTAMSGVQLVYELATPLEYTITPQQIETLLGENNVWSNDGDISELIYMFTNEIIINNEGMPAIPTINASEAGPTVTLRGASHVLAAGDNRFSDIILQSGENVMQVEDPAGTLTIKYQEGML